MGTITTTVIAIWMDCGVIVPFCAAEIAPATDPFFAADAAALALCMIFCSSYCSVVSDGVAEQYM